MTPADVVWTYSGVRPLFDDGSTNASAVTRDYVFDMDAPQGQAPVLSIFGGKITTFRKLAEHALDELKTYFPNMKPAWTEKAKMPGGDMPDADFDRFFATVRQRWPFLPEQLAHRLARAYGTRIEELLGSAKSHGRSRRGFRRRADGGGSRLSGAPRMGAQRRGHPLAPLQARAACAG